MVKKDFKIEIKDDISPFETKELLKFLIDKLDFSFEEKEIKDNIKRHFKNIKEFENGKL